MGGKQRNEFSHLLLDGSAVHAAWAQLYTRCAEILQAAIEQKQAGCGLFARPESDVGLLGLIAVMNAIDPNAGWLESGFATFTRSLRDALARAPEVHWGSAWLDPLELHQYGAFAEFNAAALLHAPRTAESLNQQIARLLIGIADLAPEPRPARGRNLRRRKLYDLLQAQGAALRRFLMRPDGTYPKVAPETSIVLDDDLGAPLWTNVAIPSFPGNRKVSFHRLGEIAINRAHDLARDAQCLLKRIPILFGLQHLPENYEKYSLPHRKWWIDIAAQNPSAAALTEQALIDRVFGATAADFLAACLATSRLGACATRWSLPHSPRWLLIEGWEATLLSCMIGDDYSANVWQVNFPRVAAKLPPSWRACGEVLAEWISERRWPKMIKIPNRINAFEKGFLKAMQGLCEGSTRTLSQGVLEMMKAYPRVDYRPAEGRRRIVEICVEAVALQRMARKSGLRIDVSPDSPNDSELVEAGDPVRPCHKWCFYPGLERVANSPDEFDWPALYLNQPVESVADSFDTEL